MRTLTKQEIGRRGGNQTLKKYGKEYFREISLGTRISKKQIAALGYQKAYRSAYRRGRRAGIKDSTVLYEVFLQPGNTYHATGIGQFSNFLPQNVRVIVIGLPKV